MGFSTESIIRSSKSGICGRLEARWPLRRSDSGSRSVRSRLFLLSPVLRNPPTLSSLSPGVSRRDRSGFTLLEVLFVTIIIGILASMSAPRLQGALEKARVARAIGDIDAIGWDILSYEMGEGQLPNSLALIGRSGTLDPWGNPYQYLPIRGKKPGKGAMRKDRFLVPINSDFDLYSMGPDGKSVAPLTAAASHDDIIRANDGGYVGIAERY